MNKEISKKDAVSLLSFLEVNEDGMTIYNTQWYKGIYDDLKAAIELAVKVLNQPDLNEMKNSEVILKLFPNATVELNGAMVNVQMDKNVVQTFTYEWWNSPYGSKEV